MGFSCGSSVPAVFPQPPAQVSARAGSNIRSLPRRGEDGPRKNEKRSAMQAALIPRSRSETLRSPDWPALPSKSAPLVSALRRGSSHPGSIQKISPAARPKPAHTPGSTAHGESSFPADPAPSASASPKHVLSCPSVYQFPHSLWSAGALLPLLRSQPPHPNLCRGGACPALLGCSCLCSGRLPRCVFCTPNGSAGRAPFSFSCLTCLVDLTPPNSILSPQTHTETHSPPPPPSPPPSTQSSTHSDIPPPTKYETSPDHPSQSSPPPPAARSPPTDAPPSSPNSSQAALPAPPSANCCPDKSPAVSFSPPASPSTP